MMNSRLTRVVSRLTNKLFQKAAISQASQRQAVRTFSATSASSILAPHDTFIRRHLGVSHEKDIKKMLDMLGYSSVDELINATVPRSIASKNPLAIGEPRGENQTLQEFQQIMNQNKVYKTYIGAGYYDTITPPVILRNITENPGWYTPYTPYQAEIAQGRLEMLLNYQTMICDLTGLPVANGSLLDEATACAEAMNMCFNICSKKQKQRFFIADNVHPQTIAVMKTRAEALDLQIEVMSLSSIELLYQTKADTVQDVFGVLIQYPSTDGQIVDYTKFTSLMHQYDTKVVAATDLLALTMLQPPGEWNADVVCGSAQRFGVPLGFGGPHAAFFATQDAHKRKMPGRVIGVSKDSRGKSALRMAMQTREQHIRRDKATSNICTAQALLSNMAAAYAIYHGPAGLKQIGEKVHTAAVVFAQGMKKLGLNVKHTNFFDTVAIDLTVSKYSTQDFVNACLQHQINIRVVDNKTVAVSMDETTTQSDLELLLSIFAQVTQQSTSLVSDINALYTEATSTFSLSSQFHRTSPYLTHPVFNMYHSETEMLRYLYSLQMKDLSLATAMIPLGSCTMKLNSTSEMIPVTWPTVNHIHPFVPKDQVQGYHTMLNQLSDWLCQVTGFAAVSLQPNAGSQGEYAGLLAVRQYLRSRNEGHRTVCLIPVSAHGTNPASAVMAGFKVVTCACDSHGNIDVADLKKKAEQHKDNLGCLMVTYPSTHGVFEETIKDICDIIHTNGGQVYMDGANMNAQVGLCSPGEIGADVCHLNLHKTFCIPHGGGGPGMGPIGVAKHLAPFLPSHPFEPENKGQTGAVAAAPFSSASILPISWMYIRMMGGQGLTQATKVAILNANYMAKRLAPYFHILYTGVNGTCAHEFIVDLRPFKASAGISEEDIAKRLMDFNFHAPTMSWPVPGTLMVEPTESESLYELDRFCDALITIRQEIKEVEEGVQDRNNNTLKNAPHTADTVLSDKWDRPYPREKAAYPLAYLRQNKFWPTVGRLDNVYGDRNVVCTCPPLEAYSSN